MINLHSQMINASNNFGTLFSACDQEFYDELFSLKSILFLEMINSALIAVI